MDGQKLLKKASSVFVSHLVVDHQVHPHCLRSGYVKDVVYRTKVKDISDLKERITAAVETTDEEMLRRTGTEI